MEILTRLVGAAWSRLAFRTALAMLLSGLAPLLLVGLAARASIERGLEAEILRSQRRLIGQIELDVRTELVAYRIQLETLARHLDVVRMRQGASRPVLLTFLDHNPLFHQVEMRDGAGRLVEQASRGTSCVAAGDRAASGGAPAAVTGFGAPVVQDDGQVLLSLEAPVPAFVDGMPDRGKLVARVRLHGPEIQELVRGWQFVERTYLYVTDGSGRVVARAGGDCPGAVRRLSVRAPGRDRPGGDAVLTGRAIVCGREDLIATAYLPVLGLTVVLGRPSADVDSFVREVLAPVGPYGVAGMLLAACLGLALARSVVAPVLELTQGIRRVASGELGHRLPTDQRGELGAAAGAFNQLATQLAKTRLMEDLWRDTRPGAARSGP